MSYHQPKGFKFSGLMISYHVDFPQVVNNMYDSSEDDVVTYSGHICSDRPYGPGHTWRIHVDRQVTWHRLNGASGTRSPSSDTGWPWLYESKFGDRGAQPAAAAQVIGPATPGGPARLYVAFEAPTGVSYTVTPSTASATVPVDEDASCP